MGAPHHSQVPIVYGRILHESGVPMANWFSIVLEYQEAPIEDDDRLEAVFVMMCIEQSQLLAAVDGVERFIDIHDHMLGHRTEAGAIQIDHSTAHAQRGPGYRAGFPDAK